MLFTSEYSMKMPLFEALMTSLVGIVTVICILAILDLETCGGSDHQEKAAVSRAGLITGCM